MPGSPSRDEHLGVDLILPDMTYLADRRDRVRAVLLTHARGSRRRVAVPILREVRVPEVWGTRLTLGLRSPAWTSTGCSKPRSSKAKPEAGPVDIGPFRVEFVRVAHSVPDSVAISIETSAGRVLQTEDWKLDYTPVDGLHTDVGRLAGLRNRGVDLLLGDSTNAERPGVTGSQRLVGEAFRQIIPAVRAGCSSPRLHPTSTGYSRRSTWRSRPDGRSRSSGARCART